MGDLVVGDGEDFAGAGVEEFEAEFVFDGEPAFFAEAAVEVDGCVDVGDAVFGEEDGLDAVLFEEGDEVGGDGVDALEIGFDRRTRQAGAWRSQALEVVVQMREVDEGKGGLVFGFDPFGRLGDPLGHGVGFELFFDAGGGAPEGWEGKFAEVFFDVGADGEWVRVDVEDFAAVGGIHRARGDGIIRGGIHVVPPEKFGAGKLGILLAKGVPDFGRGDEVVGLFPELDFGEVAIVPAVGDDAVGGGSFAGDVVGLGSAGDGGESGFDGGDGAGGGAGPFEETRRIVPVEERGREADDIDDGGALH